MTPSTLPEIGSVSRTYEAHIYELGVWTLLFTATVETIRVSIPSLKTENLRDLVDPISRSKISPLKKDLVWHFCLLNSSCKVNVCRRKQAKLTKTCPLTRCPIVSVCFSFVIPCYRTIMFTETKPLMPVLWNLLLAVISSFRTTEDYFCSGLLLGCSFFPKDDTHRNVISSWNKQKFKRSHPTHLKVRS